MRQGNVPPRRDQLGFTLVEVMVAALILMVGVLGTFVMIDGANKTQRANNARTSFTALAREVAETARALPYTTLADASVAQRNTLIAQLRANPQIAGELDAGGNWVITRRNVKVLVSASVCTFDDPMDGNGVPAPTDVCTPQPAAVTGTPEDSNPDDFRRMTITLSWSTRTPSQIPSATATCNSAGKLCVQQITQVNNPGGGLGPRITSFPDPFAGQLDQTYTATTIPFKAVSTYAHTVRWSVDDGKSTGIAAVNAAGTNGGAGYDWMWDWTIGAVKTVNDGTWTLDGVYTANAQPFDDRGIPGEMRVATVRLNRTTPLKPPNFSGGRSKLESFSGGSGDTVDMDWGKSPERDVLGYRVYRVETSGAETRICPPVALGTDAFITATSCTDTAPLSGDPIKYRLYAVDRPVIGNPASAPRNGAASELSVGPMATNRLDAPSILVADVANGRPHLTWTEPTNGTTAFYRIYRDGVRISRTLDASKREFFDGDFGTTTAHDYQVSAVDANYREGKLSDVRRTP